MRHDNSADRHEAHDDHSTVGDTVYAIGQTLAGLAPGPLADLRRMSLEGDDYGAPYFWRLVARHGLHGDHQRTWARIIQIMAILTAKGRNDKKQTPHEPRRKVNGWRGLGHALCDGGDKSWNAPGKKPTPVFSEQRLARLLATKGDMRADLMERAARMLAAKKPAETGIDCTDIAHFLLFDNNPQHVRKIASDYYARLDRATREGDEETDTETATGDHA
jgi:CRISPR system Cascade subunit CasB